jgi:hypothetical protein
MALCWVYGILAGYEKQNGHDNRLDSGAAHRSRQGSKERESRTFRASVGHAAAHRVLRCYRKSLQKSREFQAFRQEILARLDDGAWVEPGELSVTVREFRQQRLTQAFLTEALGAGRVRELKEQARPTVYRHLIVQEEGAGGGRGVDADTL